MRLWGCAVKIGVRVSAHLSLLQGGDPTGTGMGGESIYGPTFKDEVDRWGLGAPGEPPSSCRV